MNHMYEHVGRWMRRYRISMTFKDLRLIVRHTRVIRIPKNTIIMPQGKMVTQLYFVNNGMVRLLRQFRDSDTTIDFIPEYEFASTVIYIRNEQLSPCALETLTDVDALYWEKEEVLYLLENISCGTKIEQAMLDRLLNWGQDREIDIITLTPEERYIKLLRENPAVVSMIPLKYIASYLGIHQDSLSRIRNKVSRKS